MFNKNEKHELNKKRENVQRKTSETHERFFKVAEEIKEFQRSHCSNSSINPEGDTGTVNNSRVTR
jgi:hypothetical protein